MSARKIGAIFVGFLTWWVVASLISLGLKLGWPAYAAAEPAMHFTHAMLAARLTMGALASLAAGWVTNRLAPGSRNAVLSLSLLLLVFFIPVHVRLFAAFPIWYHLVFLGSLVPLTMVGWWVSVRRA